MTEAPVQTLGGLTPQEFKRLLDFVTEHELNVPRYKAAKAKLDAAFLEQRRLDRQAKQDR
jgi:hypothetical protein